VDHLNNTTQIHPTQALQETQEPICVITIGAQTKTPSNRFDQILLEALDSVFSSLKYRKEIYQQLESKHGINRQTIPLNPTEFTDALEKIFRNTALLVEIKIIQLLHAKAPDFKHCPKKDEITFSSYLEDLKNFASNTPWIPVSSRESLPLE
jgi:hypothetical protein